MREKVAAVTVNNLMALVDGFVLFHRGKEEWQLEKKQRDIVTERLVSVRVFFKQVLKQQNECRNQNRSNIKDGIGKY